MTVGLPESCRRSVRAYLPKPVEPLLLEGILQVAALAPSGVNTQPWKVHVVTGTSLEKLKDLLVSTFLSGKPEKCGYQYYPVAWRSPYVDRRRSMLEALFGSTGVIRGDEEALKEAVARNYRFYGAPVGLVFSIDNDLAQGSWLDYGMFLQSLMLAAKGLELATCAEVSIANYPDEVRSFLGIPQEEIIVCGMALGYADADAPVNSCSLPREAVNSFTRFHYDGSRQKKESDKELLYSAGVSAR